MSFQLPEDVVNGLAPEVKDIITKPEVLAVIEQVNAGLVKKRDELLTDLGNIKKTYEPFGSPDNIKARLDKLAQLEDMTEEEKRKAAAAHKDVEAVRAEMEGRLTAANDELKTYKQAVAEREVTLQLRSAISEAGGDEELLMPFVKGRVKYELGADGAVKVAVRTSADAPMLNKDGKDATLADLVGEFKASDKYARLFKAVNTSGAGSSPSGNQGPGVASNPFAKNSPHWNVTAQAQLIRSNPELAKSLASAAGVKLPGFND